MKPSIIKDLPHPPRIFRRVAQGITAAALMISLSSCQQVEKGMAATGRIIGSAAKAIGDGYQNGTSPDQRSTRPNQSSGLGVFSALFPGDLGTILDVVVAANYGASADQREQATRKAGNFRQSSTNNKKLAAARKSKGVKYIAVEVKKDSSKSSESGKHMMMVNAETLKPKNDKVFIAKNVKPGSIIKVGSDKAVVGG